MSREPLIPLETERCPGSGLATKTTAKQERCPTCGYVVKSITAPRGATVTSQSTGLVVGVHERRRKAS